MIIINQYRGAVDQANLFIGGVSASIGTAALLAAKFTFIEGDVEGFQIDGDDISARITNTDYDIVTAAFKSNTEITSIIETAEFCTLIGLESFELATNLVFVNLIGVTEVKNEAFFAASSLHAKDLLLPNLTTVNPGNSAFRLLNASLGETLSFPSVTTMIGTNMFRDFGYTVDLPACTTFGNTDTCAQGTGTLNIPVVTDLGGSTGNDSVFAGTNTALIVNANDFLETNNGGSPDGDLQAVIGTVNYIDTSGIPNPVIDLATVDVLATILVVDWSVPIGGNTIKEYNIELDDVFIGTTPLLEFTIEGLTALQTYKVVVKAVDYVDTESADSNILNVLMNGDDIPLSNMISRYTFEDNANDVVGTNNGAATNLTYVTAGVGKSGSFNGTNSYVTIPDDSTLSFGSTAFSISLLISFDTNTVNSRFLAKRDIANTQNEYQITYQVLTNRLNFSVLSPASAPFLLRQVAFTPTVSQMYHVTATHNGSNNIADMKVYVDGVELTDTALNTISGVYAGMTNGTSFLTLGAFRQSVDEHDGLMDEVIFWDKELTKTEVTNISTEQLAGTDIDP